MASLAVKEEKEKEVKKEEEPAEEEKEEEANEEENEEEKEEEANCSVCWQTFIELTARGVLVIALGCGHLL